MEKNSSPKLHPTSPFLHPASSDSVRLNSDKEEIDMPVMEVSDATFEAEVAKSATPVLVDFWAVWCGPCRMIAPVVEELSKEYAGKMKFCKVNVDDNNETAIQFGIRSIPTLLLFKRGEIAGQVVGAVSKEKLKTEIEAVLK